MRDAGSAAMRIVMHPEAIYGFSIWALAGLTVALAVLGAVVIETIARRVVPLALRRAHNDVAAALFGTIGTTYAVLLAFVAMLAWEGFEKADVAANDEAQSIMAVAMSLDGMAGSMLAELRASLAAYARGVMTEEWPAQARGDAVAPAAPAIAALDRAAASMHPQNAGEANLQARLLAATMRLADARAARLRAAAATIPSIIWLTLLCGGSLTIVAASFVAAPSLGAHLAMSSVLAVSGALVLVLIIALSNPFRGDFRIGAEPYARVLARLEAPSS